MLNVVMLNVVMLSVVAPMSCGQEFFHVETPLVINRLVQNPSVTSNLVSAKPGDDPNPDPDPDRVEPETEEEEEEIEVTKS